MCALIHQAELLTQQVVVQGTEEALGVLAHLDEYGVSSRWQGFFK